MFLEWSTNILAQLKHTRSISSTVLVLAIFLLLFKFLAFIAKQVKTLDLKKSLTRSRAGLIFGSPEDVMNSILSYMNITEPTPYTFWLGHVRYVVIGKPEDLQIILNNSYCLEKSFMYKFLQNMVGNGLFTAPVEKWKKHRRLIMPSFNSRLLEEMFPIFNDININLVSNLRLEANNDVHFDLGPNIISNALDIICQTSLGFNLNISGFVKTEFEEAVRITSEASSMRIYKPWLHPQFIFKIYTWYNGLDKFYKLLHSLSEQIIKQKQNELVEKKFIVTDQNRKNKSTTFLDSLLDLNKNGVEFSDTDLRDEVLTMMIGGSETSAITLSFTFLMLAINPSIQEKAYQEIVKVLGNENRFITRDDANKLTFLEQCLRETLRLFPPGPIILRRATKDVLLSDNSVLKVGSNIIVPPLKVQRDSKIYRNPLVWNPDNFSSEETAKRHKYSFIAFSEGPRGCIGSKYAMLSMKVTLSMVLREYYFTTDVKMEDIKLKLDLLMRSVDGYKVKLFSRKRK